MDDLISRQAAISRAVTIPMFGRDIRVVGVSELESLPSAQPYTDEEIQKIQDLEQAELDKVYELGKQAVQPEPQWISCKDRLPKQGQEVICQCRANIIKVLKLDADGDWYQDAEHCYMGGFAVAWMPLPEPSTEIQEVLDYLNTTLSADRLQKRLQEPWQGTSRRDLEKDGVKDEG